MAYWTRVTDKERAEATARYLAEFHAPVYLLPLCGCKEFPYRHMHEGHRRLWDAYSEQQDRREANG